MRILKTISDEFWWDVARTCDYATFYHTPIWREIAQRAFPGRYQDATFGAILPSGVRVVFPLYSQRQLGPIRWLESTFAGCYGGFIADGPVSPDEAASLYRHVLTWSTHSFYVFDNPLSSSLSDLKSKLNLVVKENAYAVSLDADFDTVFSRFSSSMRRNYRLGVKRGVQIRLAQSVDDCRAYYASYRDAVDRWGEGEGYGYSWEQFEQIYQLSLIYPENIKFWLMIVNDQIVGGRIAFYWRQQVTQWNGSALRDFLGYYVIPVADTEMIRDAITQGYRYFDFSTCNHKQSLIEYKERFAPIAVPLCGWLYEKPVITLSRALYRNVRQVLSLLHSGAAFVPGIAMALLQAM
jgi:hypothetical protein